MTRFATGLMFPLASANIALDIDTSPGDLDKMYVMMKYEVLLKGGFSQR